MQRRLRGGRGSSAVTLQPLLSQQLYRAVVRTGEYRQLGSAGRLRGSCLLGGCGGPWLKVRVQLTGNREPGR